VKRLPISVKTRDQNGGSKHLTRIRHIVTIRNFLRMRAKITLELNTETFQ